MTILGFRDPHAFAKNETFFLGLEQQEDQPLLDAIENLTRDQASYLRLLILSNRHVGVTISLTKERMSELISAARNFQIAEESRTMQ